MQSEHALAKLKAERDYYQIRAELTAAMLRTTSLINASLSFSQVVRRILDSTHRLLGVNTSCIMLADPSTGELSIVGSRGVKRATVETLRFAVGQGIAGRVAQTGKPLLVADVFDDRRFVVAKGKQRLHESLACAPLKSEARVIGVISVDKPARKGAITRDDLVYLSILADHASVAIKNARMHENLLQRATQLSTLYEVGSALSSVLNVDRLLGLIVESVTEVTGAQICSLMMLDRRDKTLRIRVAKGVGPSVIKRVLIPLGEGISGWVAKAGKPLLVENIEDHPLFKKKSQRKYSSKSLLSVPLKIKGEVIGVLNVNNKLHGDVFNAEDQNLLTLFASHAAIAIENANLYKHLEQLAITDGLTSLYVHRYFQEQVGKELKRARRFHRPLSVVMLDIDHFKHLNDTYGHPTGDSVLRELAMILQKCARDEDLVARYGGEEFILALLETDVPGAMLVAERIRRAIDEYRFVGKEGGLRVTVSIGVSSFPRDASAQKELIKQADQGLYRAKHTGRNRVVHLGDEPRKSS